MHIAVTGPKFVVADRMIAADGLWTAIWYGGREVWFETSTVQKHSHGVCARAAS